MTQRRTSRWGDGLEGQRLPHCRIVVTERTRRGPAKRHTFVLDADTWDAPGGLRWVREAERSNVRVGGDVVAVAVEPLPEMVTLARGVDLPASALTVILDAAVSGARHFVDLSDVKAIVSQLGSRIGALATLTDHQRRIAEPALFGEILRRCTTMGNVSF